MKPVDLVNLTASQIDNLKVEKEKELRIAEDNLHKVALEKLELGKQIILLEGQSKDLQIAISKARHITKILESDIRILTSEFWRAKDSR